MQQVKPIVGVSKIIDLYDAVICGFNGVISKKQGINLEAVNALFKMSEAGKEIVILSNLALRVETLIQSLKDVAFDLSRLKAVITAGELMHYFLKNTTKYGHKYYNLGSPNSENIFQNLAYQKVTEIENADFLFIADLQQQKGQTEDYIPLLEVACALNLPLLCVGTDVSFCDGEDVVLGAAAIAEQYAVMGGKIITIGKPEEKVLRYTIEAFKKPLKKILVIGDNCASDIKAGQIIGADTLLISKGVHTHTLGEGYIPDVEKARNLAAQFGVELSYVMSGLRW